MPLRRPPRQGVIVENPVSHFGDAVAILACAADDAGDAGVDDHPLAHGAGACVAEDFISLTGSAGEKEGAAQGVPPGGGYDRIGFGVYTAAELIALPRRDGQGLPGAAV